jgi:hypothetical protein
LPNRPIHWRTLYYNLKGPLSYMRSVIDRNIVMRRMTVVQNYWYCTYRLL